jgi:hypothetical protein
MGEAAEILVESGKPAAVFLGHAIESWLEQGGDLVRDYLKLVTPKSHRTAPKIWAALRATPHQDERQLPISENRMGSSSSTRGSRK